MVKEIVVSYNEKKASNRQVINIEAIDKDEVNKGIQPIAVETVETLEREEGKEFSENE